MHQQRFVLVKGAAGLGNRILCALTGILYAQLTGRQVIIDWRDPVYSDNEVDVFPLLFHSSHCMSVSQIPDTRSVYPTSWIDHLHESAEQVRRRSLPGKGWDPNRWNRVSIDLRRLDYPETVVVLWFFTEEIDRLRRHFKKGAAELRGQSTKHILRRQLRMTLTPTQSIRQRVNTFKRERFGSQMIGVHVRFSDKRSRIRKIRQKLDQLLKSNPQAGVFLATDNLQIQDLFCHEYPGVVTTPKWYPAPGSRSHRNPECPDRVENAKEALVDLCLLAECDYLILDESSAFSYVASLLAEIPSSHIFNLQLGHWIPERLRRSTWFLILRVRREINSWFQS